MVWERTNDKRYDNLSYVNLLVQFINFVFMPELHMITITGLVADITTGVKTMPINIIKLRVDQENCPVNVKD